MFKVFEVVEEEDGGATVTHVRKVCEAPCLAELCNAIEDHVFRESEARRKAAAEQHGTRELRGVMSFGEFAAAVREFGAADLKLTRVDPPDDLDDADDGKGDDDDSDDGLTPLEPPAIVHPHLWSDAAQGR